MLALILQEKAKVNAIWSFLSFLTLVSQEGISFHGIPSSVTPTLPESSVPSDNLVHLFVFHIAPFLLRPPLPSPLFFISHPFAAVYLVAQACLQVQLPTPDLFPHLPSAAITGALQYACAVTYFDCVSCHSCEAIKQRVIASSRIEI